MQLKVNYTDLHPCFLRCKNNIIFDSCIDFSRYLKREGLQNDIGSPVGVTLNYATRDRITWAWRKFRGFHFKFQPNPYPSPHLQVIIALEAFKREALLVLSKSDMIALRILAYSSWLLRFGHTRIWAFERYPQAFFCFVAIRV